MARDGDAGEADLDRARDEQLQSITIGERRPLNAKVTLVPYDPQWPEQFERHARLIRAALGARVVQLEHVGSTSVPGLSAKPVLDMVLAVADSSDEAVYVPPLEAHGFVLHVREPAWFEHRLLKAPGPHGNLHVFTRGCEEIGRMVAFRDWLRTHEEERQLYERTKRALAQRTWRHTQDYADAKTDVVRAILARALAGR